MLFKELMQEQHRRCQKTVALLPRERGLEVLEKLSQRTPLHVLRHTPDASAEIEKVPQGDHGGLFIEGCKDLRLSSEKLSSFGKGLGFRGGYRENKLSFGNPAHQTLGVILHKSTAFGVQRIPPHIGDEEGAAPERVAEEIAPLKNGTVRQVESTSGEIPPQGAAIGTRLVSPVNTHTSWTMIFGSQETTPPCSISGMTRREGRASPAIRHCTLTAPYDTLLWEP